MLAVGLAGIDGAEAPTTEQVFDEGDGLEVRRTNTPPISAEMVERQPCGDGTVDGFVSDSMGQQIASLTLKGALQAPIAVTADRTLPFPATSLGDCRAPQDAGSQRIESVLLHREAS